MSDLLRALGERVGILPEYVNFDGSQRVRTSDETYRAILQCLGYDADDDASLRRALESIQPVSISQARSSSPCISCTEKSTKRQLRGLWCNLYSIRSSTNWGVGDFGDLRRLVQWAATLGLDFVAINPLHALRNRGHDVSPYRPTSRLYRNEIYLDLEAVPEFQISEEARSQTIHPQTVCENQQARDSVLLDYPTVLDRKRDMLTFMHRAFQAVHERGKTDRGLAYLDYLAREGEQLRNFATFVALDEMFEPMEELSFLPIGWPYPLIDSRSKDIERYALKYSERIDFHCYVQFELDRQLASIAKLAKDSGMAIGLMGDLAIGTSPDGSDPWAYPELFLKEVSIGAPPDDLGPQGQNWGLPPMHPRVLAETDFAYWRKLIQNNLAHMGALRIDHVMGLLRQFWIPDGFDGSKGAYMQFPAEEMFSILAEESRRSGTVIIGEDLGTVPEGFREMMQRYGLLSTRVVYFEREWDGSFKPASAYPRESYVVVGTHDMAPLAGFAHGSDLKLRRSLGLIENDVELAKAMEQRKHAWHQLVARLMQEGMGDDIQEGDVGRVGRALVRFLAKTPACLVGFSLDDLAGEREPVNVPGVGQDRHPSWSRRMAMPLEQITSSPSIRETLTGVPS